MTLVIGKKKKKNLTNRGITLIEVAVVLAIIAFMGLLVVPQIGFLTGADLDKATVKIGEMIKYAYTKSVINNTRYRIVFNLEEGTLIAEYVKKEEEELKTDEKAEDKEESKEKEKIRDDEKKMVFKQDKFVKEENDELLAPMQIPSSIRISGIYTFHSGKVINEGSDFITFLPNGFVEKAIIYLEDGFNRIKTLRIYELTGQTQVFDDYIEPDEIDEQE